MHISNSERLQYRPLGPDDSQLLFELDQDPEVMRYINGGTPTTMEEIRVKYLPRLMSYSHPDKGWGMWGLTTLDNPRFIGWILTRPHNFFNEERDDSILEIGWRLFRKDWGHGFATEAASHIMKTIERELGVSSFSALAMEENEASIRVMKKLGMKYVKTYLYKDPLGDEMCVHYETEPKETV